MDYTILRKENSELQSNLGFKPKFGEKAEAIFCKHSHSYSSKQAGQHCLIKCQEIWERVPGQGGISGGSYITSRLQSRIPPKLYGQDIRDIGKSQIITMRLFSNHFSPQFLPVSATDRFTCHRQTSSKPSGKAQLAIIAEPWRRIFQTTLTH